MRSNFFFAFFISLWLFSCVSLVKNKPYSSRFDSGLSQVSYSLIFDDKDSSFIYSFKGGLANDTIQGNYSIKNKTIYLDEKASEVVKKGDSDFVELTFYDGVDKRGLAGVLISFESGEQKVVDKEMIVLKKEQPLIFNCLGYKGSESNFFTYGKWDIHLYPTFRNPTTRKWRIGNNCIKNNNSKLKLKLD